MADSNTDFTYLSVLRELEKEVAKLAGKEAPEAGAELTRANTWFREIGGLLSFATGKIASGSKSIAKKLEVSVQAIKKAEETRLRHLSSWTQKQTRYEIGKAATWPPLIPIGLTVERFVGTTIGLHSESPDEPFCHHVHSSLKDAVAPALAWGLWCQLHESAAENRNDTAEAIRSSIMRPSEDRDVAKLAVPWRAGFFSEVPYLRLLHGWANIVGQQQAQWALSADAVNEFRGEVLHHFDRYLTDPNSGLSDLLLRHYGATDQGMDRARIVAMVQRRSPNSAAFLRSRLSLLSGANLPALERFKQLLINTPAEALKDAEDLMSQEPRPEAFGELACGRAYWLARFTYGKHDSKGVLEAKASTLTLRLLQEASSHFHDDDEKRAYCLRFAAGYATNPRYFRSDEVLKSQEQVVSGYELSKFHRPKLAEMFKARIAWQYQASSKGIKNQRDAKRAARFYYQALDGAFSPNKGLDSEAPVHLFPELYVFLDSFDDNKARSKNVLAVIDHVVQHNFAVYFDAPTEERLIKAGIRQFQEWHEASHGDISPEDALRGLAPSKGDGDYRLHGILEGKVKKANAQKPRADEDANQA